MSWTEIRFNRRCEQSAKGLRLKQMNSTESVIADPRPVSIGFFERYLTVWVALCIVGGILLGQVLPGLFQAIGAMEVAHVNIPVGLLIWIMIIPMLVKIDFAAMS